MSDAGLLAAISDAESRLARRGTMRPGVRVLLLGAADGEREEWVRSLTAAGARVSCFDERPRGKAEREWLDAELMVAASDAALAAALAEPERPGLIAVCRDLSASQVSALLRAGVLDILVRPIGADGMVDACAHAVERAPRRPLRRRRRLSELPVAGANGAALARTRLPVLLIGETGTGKSRMARMLHETLTPGAPFVEINAAGLASNLLTSELFGHERGAFTGAHAAKPGLVALAHGGTLFLDEIGELPADAQAQLLSFLDTGSFRPVGGVRETRSDARIVCATNRDLDAAVRSERFREDLYYRLASIVVPLPPLRHQAERIPRLVHDLADQAAARSQLPQPAFTPEAMAVMARYEWPGNVRQLRFVVEHLVALADGQPITAAHAEALLPTTARPVATGAAMATAPASAPVPGVRPLAEMERDMVARAMREAGGNRTRAAELLGITPRGLYNKLRRNGTSFRPQE